MAHARVFAALAVSLLLIVANSISESDAVARLIRVPLLRGTTQSAGQLGQPVISYYAPVSIGTPPKVFNVEFDVDFNELFVPHYEWNPFKTNLHYGKGFQCKVSSSCVKDKNSLTIEYQHCKLSGKLYEDVITFNNAYGNLLGPNVNVSVPVSMRQSFLAAADASDARFKDLPIDGVFGLGPLAKSSTKITNLLVNLHENKLIDNLQFSFWFNPVLDSIQGGELVLGGIDTQRYQGKIYWHHLSAVSGQWTLGLQYVSLGNQVVGCYGHSCQAMLSTGLTDLYGPRDDVMKIYALLNSSRQKSGLELIDCRRISSLPIITFTIDGIPYPLLPTNYIRKTVDGAIFKSETCYVAILPSDSHRNEWILGTNFLGTYYSMFDMTYRQVGFATLK